MSKAKSVILLRSEKLTKQRKIWKPLATCNIFKETASKKALCIKEKISQWQNCQQNETMSTASKLKSLGTQAKGCYTTSTFDAIVRSQQLYQKTHVTGKMSHKSNKQPTRQSQTSEQANTLSPTAYTSWTIHKSNLRYCTYNLLTMLETLGSCQCLEVWMSMKPAISDDTAVNHSWHPTTRLISLSMARAWQCGKSQTTTSSHQGK